MKIFNSEKEYDVMVYDLETLKCMFLATFYNPDTNSWLEFEVSEYKNDLYQLVKQYSRSRLDYVIGFNNLNFDAQVMEYILSEYNNWHSLTNLDICKNIYKFVQDLIEDQKYNVRVPYYENMLSVDQIDCFTILGLNNEARYTSLKSAQFNMGYISVEEMPIPHDIEYLSEEDIQKIKSYCRNDISSTYSLFDGYVLGNTKEKLYRGKNQLDLRYSIREEFGLPCLNYSDIKIGDELLKLSYAKQIGKAPKDLPKKGYFRKSINLKHCIPSYVNFSTPELNKVLKDTFKTIGQDEKHETSFVFKGTNYTIGLGGGHSDNKNQIWKESPGYRIVDLDVGSLYPAIIVNNQYFPKHLGTQLLTVYESLYRKRIHLKPQSKTDKKIAGICEAIKLILNSAYGKMGSKQSWMYDKKVQVSVCLTGQFALLMLIEQMELAGIHVFSFNTDGITLILPDNKTAEFTEICSRWENLTKFVLERTDYSKIIYSTVNDYLAIKTDGEIKKKGDFLTDFEIHKNPSKKVIPMALEKYFLEGISPLKFIREHDNILDFCIRSKATGGARLELVSESGASQYAGKMLRYYLIDDKDYPELYKRGIGTVNNVLNTNQAAENELGKQRVRPFNRIERLEEYNIDYKQYILPTLRIIDKIEGTKKSEDYIKSFLPTKQLDLFK